MAPGLGLRASQGAGASRPGLAAWGAPGQSPALESVPRARWTQEGNQQETEIQAEAAWGTGEQGGQAGEVVREHTGG